MHPCEEGRRGHGAEGTWGQGERNDGARGKKRHQLCPWTGWEGRVGGVSLTWWWLRRSGEEAGFLALGQLDVVLSVTKRWMDDG